MPNTIDTCRNCGSRNLEWQKDNGWVTGAWWYLRCKMCGDSVRMRVPWWWWLSFFAIATAAAVWGWMRVFQQSAGG